MLYRALPQIREAVLRRADLTAQGLSSTQTGLDWLQIAELNDEINSSVAELYDLLVTKYQDYFLASSFSITTAAGTQQYALPIDFHKMRGVEAQLGTTAGSAQWMTLKAMPFEERNLLSFYPTAWNVAGFPNVRYCVMGTQIWFMPTPLIPASVRIWYIPSPPKLVDALPVNPWPGAGKTVTEGTLVLVSGYVYEAVVAGATGTTQPTWPTTAGTVTDNTVTWALVGLPSQFATVLDTLARWDEFVVVDAAIKILVKAERDATPLMMRKAGLVKRIEDSASNRDAGSPKRIVDVHRMNSYPFGADWGDE